MKTLCPSNYFKKILSSKTNKEKVIDFYNEATEDYEFWSKDFNMHFGYYTLKTNPFKRDTMLNEMNRQIFDQFQLSNTKKLIADLGCGMGATMRYGLKNNQTLNMIGLTLSDFQVQEGNKLLKKHNGVIVKGNYNTTPFKDNSLDGVIAIESLCHSGHKYESFKEAFRVLKPNSKLVIADAFLKKEITDLCIGSKYCYEQLCKGWSLDRLGNIHNIKKHLKSIGFKNIEVKDLSFRIAPSVLHVPFAITGFVLKKLLKKEPLKKQSIENLRGSLFALLAGLHLNSFGYYMITATK
ncbi:class I SAM-dependent methyltransferase [Pseudofulvibacter geojedonensis]|uniref:Class I SAM-dependent methyltransferase n=1 Tax=Pseudofulvibacter geojedonensis TaxID=1123758 RepID=A0ABW3I567_9FLAO